MRVMFLVGVSLVLALTACNDQTADVSQQPTSGIEDGGALSTFEDAGLAFEYPASWEARAAEDQLVADRLVEIIGERVQEGAPETVAVNVAPAPLDIDSLESSLTTGAFDPGSGVGVCVERTALDIAGADASRVVEIHYPATDSRDFDLREQMLIVLVGANGVVFRVVAPDELWENRRDGYEAIVESFRLEG